MIFKERAPEVATRRLALVKMLTVTLAKAWEVFRNFILKGNQAYLIFNKRKKEWIRRMKLFLFDVIQKKKERTICNNRLPVEVTTFLLLPTLLTLFCRIRFQRANHFFDLLKYINLFLGQDPLLIVNSFEVLILVDEGLKWREIIRTKYATEVPLAVPKHPFLNFLPVVNSDTNIKYSKLWPI